MKPFIITFVVVLVGGLIVGAIALHFSGASSDSNSNVSVGHSSNFSPTAGADRAMASIPNPAGGGNSAEGGNPNQKIISDPNNKAYQDAGLDEQVQQEKDSGRPVQTNQPK